MTETKTTDHDRADEAPPSNEKAPEGDAEAGSDEHDGSNGTLARTTSEDGDAAVGKAEPSSEEKEKEEEKGELDDLLARGNPLQYKRGILTILAGGVPAFLLMAKNGQNGWGITLGFVFVAICAFGVMDLLGTFDDADEKVASSTTLNALFPSLGAVVALAFGFGALLAMAQSATISPLLASALVPIDFLALVGAVFNLGTRLGPWKTDELGRERPLFSRHGFWVIAVGAFLYMPLLGVFSLWDPWETHYGEVAREILARDDWISLWWAQDGWFWSKPVLNFWIQALAMGALGTHYQPDRMLFGADGMPSAHAEWIVRTPNVLMTIGAMYLLYKGVAKVFGRRAGLLGSIVLATMPDWYFLAHQTMTDMPFVAAMTGAMGLLLYGLNTDEDAEVRVYEVEAFNRKIRFSLWHLVFGAVLLCALPQIIYLLSRNLEFVIFGDGPHGFRIHWDELKSGSPGNCGLPGNENCQPHTPASVPKADTWWSGPNVSGVMSLARLVAAFEPAMQGIVWGVVIGGLLYLNWGERRARRLVYIAAWLCAAIATMAKGPAGFGLPIICAVAYVATKRRWSEILRFELVSGFLVIFAVALPWYVAMYVRHGSPFTDRLIFHDMFNRAFSHVHDTNEGDDTGIRYYLWQLGYAAFPWSGLVPLGLLWGFRRSDSALARVAAALTGRRSSKPEIALSPQATAVGDASVMLVMWFLFAFALFTFMGTKFHHYIFPAVPPAAMLIGVVLDDMLGAHDRPPIRDRILYLGGLTVTAAIATFGASKLWAGSIGGTKLDGAPNATVAVVTLVIAAALFAAVIRLFRPSGGEEETEDVRRHDHEQLMLGGAAIAGALVTVLVGRDLAMKPEGGEMAGAIRLLHLFTYNYKRPWPETLDFTAILGGFTLVAGLLGAVLAVRRLRHHAVVAVCAFAMVWAVWGLDVYMMALSPHWGQHEVLEAYYRDRKGPEEILVAYQMNWKGENFYTGNHVPAFVSSGATFTTWLKKEKEKGAKVMYFVTEHSRTSGLRSEVGAKGYKEITDKTLCNKFVLVRAEL